MDNSNFTQNIVARKEVQKGNTVFYFIRHNKTIPDGSKDPDISSRGKKNIQNLIRYFADKRLDSIFSTNFKRTINTAKPIAKSKGIVSDYFNPHLIDVKKEIKRNKGKAILYVGHSNTTPEMANQFIGSMKYSQMMDDNYSDIYRVIISGNKIYEDVLNLEEEVIAIENATMLIANKNKKRKKRRH